MLYEVITRAWYALRRAGIELATPLRTVTMETRERTPAVDHHGRAVALLRSSEFLRDLSDADLGALADGTHTVYIRGVDKDGNEGAPRGAQILIDRTGPTQPSVEVV